MYTPYADKTVYEALGGAVIPESEIDRSLRQASRHIDTLTFGRIVKRGFDSLTPFQQSLIQEVTCLQADFEYENQDELDNILSAYSINGVSATFGDSWNVKIENGIAMKRDVYAMLMQTGLTCRLLV